MRKLLSILLLMFLAGPLVQPLLALGGDAEARLPVCCRRGGVHHCAMGTAMEEGGPGVRAAGRVCPFGAQSVAPGHTDFAAVPVGADGGVTLQSRPEAQVRRENLARMVRDRARGTRGPPSVFSL